jgi:ribosomal protein S18 acetylase RimI-like enzyme
MTDVMRTPLVEDVPALAEVLGEAFADDPLYAWLQPDPDRRPALLHDVFTFILGRGLEQGEVRATADLDGVAIWTAPGVELVDLEGAERYLEMLRAHIGDRVGDVVSGMAALERHRPAEPHAALHSLAVRSSRRGAGLGRDLVRPLLARCDATGVPVWLDATNPRSIPFYRRLGFCIAGEELVPGGGPIVCAMVRKPR